MLKKIALGLSAIAGAVAVTPAFAAEWVTLPSFSSFQASSTDFASGMFNSLVGFGAVIVGVIIAAMILNKVIKLVVGAVKKITGGGRRGRGRRR